MTFHNLVLISWDGGDNMEILYKEQNNTPIKFFYL